MAVALFDKYAKTYLDKYMNVDLYAESLDFLCNAIPLDSKVADIACGPGNISGYLLNKRQDLDFLGIELSPKMVELAKALNPKAEFKIMDARQIYSLNSGYNAVIAGFLFPYLSKEEVFKIISDAFSILEKEGLLYISTVEDDYEKSGIQVSSSGEDSLYMHFYNEGILTWAFIEAGFTILYTGHIRYIDTKGNPVTDLIMIAKKGKNHRI